MFTINQIHQASKKIKSGSDFPKFVQDIKAIGVLYYDNFVEDGRTHYYGNESSLLDEAKYPKMDVNDISSAKKLKQTILNHQQGLTDYKTFCIEAAEAGVEKWRTNVVEMVVTYTDKCGEALLIEPIPMPK